MLCLMGELLSFVAGGARRAWLRRSAMIRRWESGFAGGIDDCDTLRRVFSLVIRSRGAACVDRRGEVEVA